MGRNMKDRTGNNFWVKIWTAIGLGLLLALVQGLHAQPVRDRILADLDIREQGESEIIYVGFNFPVRYVEHFPPETGEEVRIKLVPILINPMDREGLFGRESFRPLADNPAALLEVMYEGDMEGGPFLTLMFRQPMLFQVKQGDDYRSLEIEVTPSQEPAAGIEER